MNENVDNAKLDVCGLKWRHYYSKMEDGGHLGL